jgi:hypothetical protein
VIEQRRRPELRKMEIECKPTSGRLAAHKPSFGLEALI